MERLDAKQKRLHSLDGLKALAMLSLFWWHSTLPNPPVDCGARACELLFVSSGFLMGYNYYFKTIPATWNESIKYSLKKISQFWPLYLMTTVLLMICLTRPIFSFTNLCNLLISLSLLQAWSDNPDVFWAYNGVAWFLSALVFCYFMSPFLLSVMKRGIRTSMILFVAVFIIRFSIDYIEIIHPGELLTINPHVSPIIRCMEYLMGMLLVPLFMFLKEKNEASRPGIRQHVCFTLMESAVLGGACILMISHPELWRSCHVLLFCPVVLILALEMGLISWLLSIRPFRLFAQIQMEFFILHQVVMKCLNNVYGSLFENIWFMNFVMLLTVLLISALYHVFLTDRLTNRMRAFFSKLVR